MGLFGKIFRKLGMQGRMQILEKMSQNALNRVLILAQECRGKMVQNRTGIMGLQNKNNILVAKQVSYIIFVPMSYISFWVQESRPAGGFWADQFVIWARRSTRRGFLGGRNSYFGLEIQPAGAFCADKFLFWARKSTRRNLLGG